MSAALGALESKVTGALGPLGKTAGLSFSTGMKAGLVGLGAGLAITVGKELYDVGKEFDDLSDTIQTTTGESGKRLDSLVDSAVNVGKKVPESFHDVAEAVGLIHTRTKLVGKPLEAMSKQILALAKITDQDLNQTIIESTRMLGDWGLSGEKASKGLDELYRASTKTGVPTNELAQLLARYGSPLRQLGFSFEEAAAMIGKFQAEGVNTQLVLGAMRIGLGKLATEAGKVPEYQQKVTKAQQDLNKALKEGDDAKAQKARLALDDYSAKLKFAQQAARGAPKAIRDVFQAIRDAKTPTEATAIAIETFGKRAGPDMAAAIREGRLDFDQLVNSIKTGKTTIEGTEKSTRDFAENWKIFTNTLKAEVKPAADAVFAGIGEGMFQIATHFDTIKQFAQAFTPIGAIRGMLEGTSGAIKTVSALLEGDWSRAWQGVKQTLSAVPQMLGPLQLLGPLVRNAMNAVTSAVRTAVSAVGAAARAVGQAAVNGIRTALSTVGSIASSAFQRVTSAVRGVVSAVGSAARAVGQAAINGLRTALSTAGSVASSAFNRVVAAVRGIVGAAGSAGRAVGAAIVNGLRAGLSAISGVASSAASRAMAAFRSAAAGAFSAGHAVAEGLANGLRAGIGLVQDAAHALANAGKGAISGVKGFITGSPSKWAISVGYDVSSGLAIGITKGAPKAVQAMVNTANKTIDAAENVVKSRVSTLSGYLQQAFQAKQAATKTPAEQQLQALQDARDEAQRQQALADAQSQLASAQTDEERLAAQKAYEDASYQIQVAALQKQAEQQRKELEGSQYIQQQYFNTRLASLEKYLSSSHATAAGARKRITAIFNQFGMDVSGLGNLLGEGFENAVEKLIPKVVASVARLRKIVADALADLRRLRKSTAAAAPGGGGRRTVVAGAWQPGVAAATGGLQAGATAAGGGGLAGYPTAGALLRRAAVEPAAPQPSAEGLEVRVFIGDQELRGLVRTEVVQADTGLARTLLAGSRR